ncbi:hypothetical protein Syun_025374 [Stephania yunnanensis]|uniref:Uncharacterized protein n=1 Tax=Stephania yunnanensis TaxID=152371 RepID=A0AAP0ES25_9MAGN
MATIYHDFTNRLCKREFCHDYTTQEIFDSFKKMCSTPEFKARFEQCSKNRKSNKGGPGIRIYVHTCGSISIKQHYERLAKILGRPPTPLELFLHIHTRDHDGHTFSDQRVELVAIRMEVREGLRAHEDRESLV